MSGPNQISIEKLIKLLGTAQAPLILDVRVQDDFDLDRRLLPCAKRASHLDISSVAKSGDTRTVVVVCQRGAKLSQGAAAILRLQGVAAVALDGGFEAWKAATLPLIPHEFMHARWVTRHRPKIDRIACPWLIKRFINSEAEFLFVPPEHVEDVASRFQAVAFDMQKGFWTHEGDLCTFDKMIDVFQLRSSALLHLARIVRAADTGKLEAEPEAAGLVAISLGLSRQFSNDLEQLSAGMAIYDALYRWCRDATDETHNWPNQKAAQT
jgi:rhodanese-related sulfurtransferase